MLDDFEPLEVIGTGTYGKVKLVRKRDSGALFAMKVIHTKKLANHVASALTEHNILSKLNHPFIVKLHYSFIQGSKLYFLLEYCEGGELYLRLRQIGPLAEPAARFCAACVVLALECLHKNKILYRDLKPENVLIDAAGFLKLADFGLSKDLGSDSSAKSFCGTLEYLAPEIFRGEHYGAPADWWALGCLVFEMLAGAPPFLADTKAELCDMVLTESVELPSRASPVARHFLRMLLKKNPGKRLGSADDAQEVKRHPWFAQINWTALYERCCTSPLNSSACGEETLLSPAGVTFRPVDLFHHTYA